MYFKLFGFGFVLFSFWGAPCKSDYDYTKL